MRRVIVVAVAAVLGLAGSGGTGLADSGLTGSGLPGSGLPGSGLPDSGPGLRTYSTLVSGRLATDFSHNVVVRSEPTPMTAGTSYPLKGSWTGTSPIGSLMGLRMRCKAPGEPYEYSVWSTTNHYGVEHGDPGAQTVNGRWLFTPDVTADYVCELVGQAGRVDNFEEHMTVTSAELGLYGGKRGGAEWRHLGPAKRVNSTVGARTAWTLRKTYTAPEGTEQLRIYSGTETSCYSTGNHNPFVGRVTTFVDQLDDNGNVVRSWHRTSTKVIPGTLRHYKFHHVLTPQLDPAHPPTVRVGVRLRWVPFDGEGDRQGGMVNGPINVGPYTSAHAYPIG